MNSEFERFFQKVLYFQVALIILAIILGWFMILNISSVYPSGLEKNKPAQTFKGIDKNIKEQAITLLKKGESIQKVADTLHLKYQTVAGWKANTLKGRYWWR